MHEFSTQFMHNWLILAFFMKWSSRDYHLCTQLAEDGENDVETGSESTILNVLQGLGGQAAVSGQATERATL